MGPLQVGTTLSQKYKIVRLLAESGGVVLYEATDTARSRRVWIKIMQRDALNNAAALARFQREADGAKVLDVGKNDAGLPYMVATEFGADRPPPPVPVKKSKTTLPGVAPPPPRLAQDDDEPPPSSSIPLGAEEMEIVEEKTPAVPEASVIVSPLLSAPKDPVLASPLITTPPPVRVPEREPEPPPPARRASTAPTVFIERRKSNPTMMWVAALIVIASATGIVGYALGHKQPPQSDKAQPVTKDEPATTAATAATTTATPTAEPSAIPAVTASVAPSVTATASAPASATASATASVTATQATIATQPPITTATVTHTAPPVRPRKPPPATHGSSDPLTL